eukprot:248318-Chlamydomonas_euryale.AAC.3
MSQGCPAFRRGSPQRQCTSPGSVPGVAQHYVCAGARKSMSVWSAFGSVHSVQTSIGVRSCCSV